MPSPIITNKALKKMSQYGLSESNVMEAFNKGSIEKWTNGRGFNTVRKYPGYEIGVAYFVDDKNVYRITSVWKRTRR